MLEILFIPPMESLSLFWQTPAQWMGQIATMWAALLLLGIIFGRTREKSEEETEKSVKSITIPKLSTRAAKISGFQI